MNCKNCGQEAGKQKTGKLRQYCNQNCFQEYFRKDGAYSADITKIPPVGKHELLYRAELFQQAKEGSSEAKETLRHRYNVTAIWDGKEMIKL